MKVLLNVEVVFHELYGYSLNIRDIDPTYTIGDLERKKERNPGSARGRQGNRYEPGTGIPGIA